MKKTKEDKNGKGSGHAVETPPPPQVMDPSATPQKGQGGEGKEKFDDARKNAENEKKSPREE